MIQSLPSTPIFLKTSRSIDGKNFFINADKIQSIESDSYTNSSNVKYTVKNSFGEEEARQDIVDNSEIKSKLGFDVLA